MSRMHGAGGRRLACQPKSEGEEQIGKVPWGVSFWALLPLVRL